MIYLNELLERSGIALANTMVMRHRPVEPAIRRVLPSLVLERPDLFRGYQQFQWPRTEKAMVRADNLIAFIGHAPGRAVFAEAYRVAGHRAVTPEEYWGFPENQELSQLGMLGLKPEASEVILFDLQSTGVMAEWRGKLVIAWPGLERSWWRWADRNQIPVHAINEESLLEQSMPPWNELLLTWRELVLLPSKWQGALAQWRGVYFIFDSESRSGYVGSAYGADNLLGRWRSYASTGHGGNVRLKRCKPENLSFSILQRTSPDLDAEDVIGIESSWKTRLRTREFGLNEN